MLKRNWKRIIYKKYGGGDEMMKKHCKKLTRAKNAFLTVLLSASMAVGGIGLAAPSVSQAADTAGEV